MHLPDTCVIWFLWKICLIYANVVRRTAHPAIWDLAQLCWALYTQKALIIKHSVTTFSTGSKAKLLVTSSWSFWCWLNCCLSSEASSKKYIIGHTFQSNLDIIDSDSYSSLHWNRNLQDGTCFFSLPLLFLLEGRSYAMLVYLQTHDIMLRDCHKQYHFREWTEETE